MATSEGPRLGPDGRSYAIARRPDELFEWTVEVDGSPLSWRFDCREDAELFVDLRVADPIVGIDGATYRVQWLPDEQLGHPVYWRPDHEDGWGIEVNDTRQNLTFT